MSKISKNSKFRATHLVKIVSFWSFKMTKIDFSQNLCGRKFLKFAHCCLPTLTKVIIVKFWHVLVLILKVNWLIFCGHVVTFSIYRHAVQCSTLNDHWAKWWCPRDTFVAKSSNWAGKNWPVRSSLLPMLLHFSSCFDEC